ncbi:MAG: hypothetical protein JSR46_03830, partial [Verrucomicrobia bacterium]|nr:hypothetical protein [Verrucomicrobiota bacterium]
MINTSHYEIDDLIPSIAALNVKDPLSFIEAYVSDAISGKLQYVASTNSAINCLKKVMPQLSGEELLLSLLCFFQAPMRLKEHAEDPLSSGVMALTIVLCEIIPSFFLRDRRTAFHSLFGRVVWMEQLQKVVKEHQEDCCTEDKVLEFLHLTLKGSIPQRRREGFFEVLETPYDEIDHSYPHHICHDNPLQEWHVLCYWLSQVVKIDASVQRQIFEAYLIWSETASVKPAAFTLIEAGLSYLIVFFGQKREPLSFINTCDIETWLTYPLANALRTTHDPDPRTTLPLIHNTKNFATNITVAPLARLDAVIDVLTTHKQLQIDLSDIGDLFLAVQAAIIECQLTNEAPQQLKDRVELILNQIFYFHIWIFRPQTFPTIRVQSISMQIIKAVSRIMKSIAIEHSKRLIYHKEMPLGMICSYMHAVTKLPNELPNEGPLSKAILVKNSIIATNNALI